MWLKRPDGLVWWMPDPDHITRMLAEGWVQVPDPRQPVTPEPTPVVPAVAPEKPATPSTRRKR